MCVFVLNMIKLGWDVLYEPIIISKAGISYAEQCHLVVGPAIYTFT